MRTITNLFLLNLAIADLLVGVFCMPFTLVGIVLKDFVFGSFLCKLIPYLQGMYIHLRFNPLATYNHPGFLYRKVQKGNCPRKVCVTSAYVPWTHLSYFPAELKSNCSMGIWDPFFLLTRPKKLEILKTQPDSKLGISSVSIIAIFA